MTLKTWLKKHNYTLELQARGFSFFNDRGDGRWIQVLDPLETPHRFVTGRDFIDWMRKEILGKTSIISHDANAEFMKGLIVDD